MRKLPIKQNYERFLENFSSGLSKINPNNCFYAYGSAIRGDADYGRSDIDGGIILDSKVITPKYKIRKISKLLQECLSENDIPTQFNLLDRQTNQDGQFLSYPPSYIEYFQNGKAKIFSKKDYMEEMNKSDKRNEDLRVLAGHFRTIRNVALYWDSYSENPSYFAKSSRRGFGKSMEHLLSFPKTMYLILNGDTDFRKGSAPELADKLFPNLNNEIISEFARIYKKPYEHKSLIDEAPIDDLHNLQDEILTHYELMIQESLNNNLLQTN